MTIDVVEDIPRRIQYTALAAQVDFDYPFPIFADEDLLVRVDGVVQVLTTDYIVAGATNDTGGTITFLTPLTGGEIVTIWSDLAIERNSDFQQNGPWTSVSTNDQFDLLTIICQELAQKIKRCIRWPFTATQTDAGLELEPIDDWKSKYLFVDSDGHLTPTSGTGGAPAASDVSYDNGASGLSATDVQAAIDEIAAAAGGSVAGADTEVQFNDGGALGADPAFKFDKTTKTVTLGAMDDIANIVTPDATGSSQGGDLNITTGKGAGPSVGGGITIAAGFDAGSSNAGGSILLNGADPSNAGDALLQGGGASAGSDTGGQAILQGGSSVDGLSGDAVVAGGVASGSGVSGRAVLQTDGVARVAAVTGGAVEFNGDAGTAAQVLTSAGPGAPPTWETPGGGASIDIQIFSSNGTWTKPANAQLVEVFSRGGGGGGGAGGAVVTNVINASGGSGGGGGGQSSRRLLAASLGATESVTVGAAGVGGTGVASGAGNSGTNGGDSFFGSAKLCYAIGGALGNGGRTGSFSGGVGGIGYNIGGTTSTTGHGTSGGDSANNAVGGAGVSISSNDAGFQCTGGGAGGSVDVISSAEFAGGAAGDINFYSIPGGTAGGVHANGGAGTTFGGTMGVGTGGGGGGGSSTGSTPGGNGGAGSTGGGGGGGGAGVTGSTVSGDGGNGGAGVVVVVTYISS